MRHGILALGISLLLHGAVFAALLPAFSGVPETPPRALVVMSVELADGAPGQRRAERRAVERNAGSAAEDSAESAGAAARREHARRRRVEEIAARTRAAEERADERARRAEARAEAAAAARQAARERRREVARERASESSRRSRTEELASIPSSAARSGETVPPRFGAGSGANPLPPYPESARYMGHEGTVVLRVRVRPDGRSEWVRVEESSGHRALDAAARRTIAERWRFEPARRGEERVAATVLVPIRFRLEGR